MGGGSPGGGKAGPPAAPTGGGPGGGSWAGDRLTRLASISAMVEAMICHPHTYDPPRGKTDVSVTIDTIGILLTAYLRGTSQKPPRFCRAKPSPAPHLACLPRRPHHRFFALPVRPAAGEVNRL